MARSDETDEGCWTEREASIGSAFPDGLSSFHHPSSDLALAPSTYSGARLGHLLPQGEGRGARPVSSPKANAAGAVPFDPAMVQDRANAATRKKFHEITGGLT